MPLLALFLLSAALHSFVAWSLASALSLESSAASTLLWAWLVSSSLLMPMGLVRLRLAGPRVGRVLTWLGLLAMGLFSSLFVLALLRELLMGVLTAARWLGLTQLPLTAIWFDSALAVFPVALAVSLAGLWNARRTAAVVRVDVPITNLPASLEGFNIAQISDIHVGPTIRAGYLQRIVARVNLLNADMVAITGDLVDGSVDSLGKQVASLSGLHSRYGSYFVTGNHEYYSGAQQWVDKLRDMGITVLMNEHVVIDHAHDSQSGDSATIVVAGVTDFGAHHFDESQRSDPHRALLDAPEGAHVKLLLAHQPRSAAAAADAGFDLQLSGHTHGGQFWPWSYFVRLQQPFTAGLTKLNQLWVYTSRGTGYWGPPKRFCAPSEITLLRLVRA
jgi:predicted MPP superfamily phosphohydrolase